MELTDWYVSAEIYEAGAASTAASLSSLQSEVSLAPHQRFAYAMFYPDHPLSC